MKFSVCLACNAEPGVFLRRVRRLDEDGYNFLWLTDLGLEAMDVFVFMTLAVMNTSRLKISAGVHPPQLRHPAVTLNALVTLDNISNGRVLFGMGTGAPWLLGPVGRRPLRLRELRELIELSRRLMAGETVSSGVSEMLMDNVNLDLTPPQPLPIYIAATGAKTLSLGAELCEGVLAHVGAAPEVARAVQQSCAEGLTKRIRSTPFDLTPFLYTTISTDRQKAINTCAPGATTVVYRAPLLAAEVGCTPEQVERLRQGDANIEDILTEERISRLTLSGTVADCIAKLEALSEVGIDHVTLLLKGDDLDQQIDTFSREILPRFI